MLVLCLLATACGVQIGGGDEPRAATPDAMSSTTDVDAAPTPSDGGMQSGVAPACLAKGYTASPGLTSLYRVVTSARTWASAQAECAADVAGATHLVVLSSAAETQLVKSELGWVGLSDRATEGAFVNVTAEPDDQRPFLSGQPDNGSGSEDCVRMKTDGLDDDQCDNQHDYVCECDGRAPTP